MMGRRILAVVAATAMFLSACSQTTTATGTPTTDVRAEDIDTEEVAILPDSFLSFSLDGLKKAFNDTKRPASTEPAPRSHLTDVYERCPCGAQPAGTTV